ncbi:MAG: cupin domain-containing protein [Candidatus Binataceae bacterium]
MAATPVSQSISIADLEWKPAQPGVRMKHVWFDAETKRRVVVTRFEPGAKLPMHRHVGDEILYVIEGSITDESGAVTAGNMSYRPNGCVHSVSSRNGAIVFALITGGIEPAAEIGSAPPSQIFSLSELPWVNSPLAGVSQKLILEDKPTARRVVLARFEPGAQLPRHKHLGEELIYMIEGAHADDSCEIATGNFNCRPAGCVHSVSSKNGATSLAIVHGGVEPM